jgi:nucleotide-binding universal stress UspA family protein
MVAFHHVLAPVDFEPCSQAALDTAVDLARAFEARLTVLHAWDIPAAAYSGRFAPTPEIWTSLGKAARQTLDAAMTRVRERAPGAEALLLQGSPASEILAAIEGTKADLVVLGTHGRHGLSRFVLGSVAEKVVRASPVPVLTVHGSAGT